MIKKEKGNMSEKKSKLKILKALLTSIGITGLLGSGAALGVVASTLSSQENQIDRLSETNEQLTEKIAALKTAVETVQTKATEVKNFTVET